MNWALPATNLTAKPRTTACVEPAETSPAAIDIDQVRSELDLTATPIEHRVIEADLMDRCRAGEAEGLVTNRSDTRADITIEVQFPDRHDVLLDTSPPVAPAAV